MMPKKLVFPITVFCLDNKQHGSNRNLQGNLLAHTNTVTKGLTYSVKPFTNDIPLFLL